MMQVNIPHLMAELQNAPAFVQPEMDIGTAYLFNQVYTRMARGEKVRLSELDFTAFEEDDIHSLGGLYGEVFGRHNYEASSIAGNLRKIDPTSKSAAFI